MNILLLINEFEKGGAERVVSYLLKYLPQMDSGMKYYLFLLDNIEQKYLIPENVELISSKIFSDSQLMKFIRLPFHALKLKRIIKNENIKIVMSFLSRANYVNVLARIFGSTHDCLISERNIPGIVYSTGNLKDRINRYLIGRLYPECDQIIAISRGVKTNLESNFNITGEKISVIYNPIDIEMVKSMSAEPIDHPWLENKSIFTIITVGRLVKQKNHQLLIRAFKKVLNQFPDVKLIILGDGEEKIALQKLISNLGIGSSIELVGLCDNPFSFLSRADLFVLSSNTEGFGNVILEAMACDCPVISTDCQSGPNEILTKQVNGVLVPVDDIDALSNGIITLIKNENFRHRLSINAMKRVNDFDHIKIINQYHQSLKKFSDITT